MKITKLLLALKKYSFWIAVLWTVVILYFSFKSPSAEPKLFFTNADKVVHFTFYFGFVFLWFRYFSFKEKVAVKNLLFLLLIAILIGGIVELLQGLLTTTRQADIWDAVANSTGALVATIISIKKIISDKI